MAGPVIGAPEAGRQSLSGARRHEEQRIAAAVGFPQGFNLIAGSTGIGRESREPNKLPQGKKRPGDVAVAFSPET